MEILTLDRFHPGYCHTQQPQPERVFPTEILAYAKKCYAVGVRGYHTFQHALDVFSRVNHFEEIIGFRNIDAARLAALFHDAVYVPGSQFGDNERLSAEEMLKACREIECPIGHWPFSETRLLIMETIRHGQPKESFADWDTLLFLDCDMLGFAAETKEFDAQNRSIDFEFQQVPTFSPETYRQGRIKFLTGLRERGVFLAPPIQRRYEEKALANIDRALAELRA